VLAVATAVSVVAVASFVALRTGEREILRSGPEKDAGIQREGVEGPIGKTQEGERVDFDVETKDDAGKRRVKVIFASTTGNAERVAANLAKEIQDATLVNARDYLFADELEDEDVVVVVISTWTDGAPPADGTALVLWLEDMLQDFRVDKVRFLAGVKHIVVGLGSSEYGTAKFCSASKVLDKMLKQLGSRRLIAPVLLDDTVSFDQGKLQEMIQRSIEGNQDVEIHEKKEVEGILPEKAKKIKEEEVVDEEDRINEMMLGDMEDLVVVGTSGDSSGAREMVTSSQRKALTKEGYKIIGTHSAVKLCRWTKHQLRGRGGCYKHTFYGITSYQCMEATPSLACANKCVFCWRHHKNPVGREWRWKEDPPDMIVEAAIEEHRGMIKQMRGVPGVQEQRFKEAFNVRHCALSLVGEPIMYPRINELVGELHNRKISTFLVTNAQFPEAMKTLHPVTQLYVSVDAATKDALKEVDRPLFKNFWERLIGSLDTLRDKGQRTTYRLTLVKEWNMMQNELDDYAKLVERGQPDLIEIKAVTYCGKSDGSNLTMKNVPWHHEVRSFAEALCKRTGGLYGTACEHVHSCCTLLARKDIFLDSNGRWRTWIDYDRFHELYEEYRSSGGQKTFTSADYTAETPDWAVWGAPEEGFDPVEVRFRRNRKPKENSRPALGLPPSKQK